MANAKQEQLIKAFKEILKAESYGSQGEIVDALKHKVSTTSANLKSLEC